MTSHSPYKIHISRYTLYFPLESAHHYWNVKWEARVSNCCERDSGSDLQMVLLLKFTTSQQCCNKPQNQPSSKNPACISSVTLPGMVDTHFHSLWDLPPPVGGYFSHCKVCILKGCLWRPVELTLPPSLLHVLCHNCCFCIYSHASHVILYSGTSLNRHT